MPPVLLDLAFLIGAGAAVVIVPLALVAVRRSRPPRWIAVVTAGVGVATAVAFVAHWVVWALAFDYVRGEPVPNGLFPVTTVLMVVSAVGSLVLVVLAGWSLARAGRRRDHRPDPAGQASKR
jgi:hypothetical protein